ncbi:MAG: sulfate reduction electron transfer complex DsrMKJOP subunit DsrJ [Pseudomonadota bacterium]
MYDGGKIIAGLTLFLGLATFPVWYNLASGSSPAKPTLATPSSTPCVAPVEQMRATHMDLLSDWREQVIRQGNRNIAGGDDGSSGGQQQHQTQKMSLTSTCLGCHGPAAQFCDRCHNYASAKPTCWACHLDSTGGN